MIVSVTDMNEYLHWPFFVLFNNVQKVYKYVLRGENGYSTRPEYTVTSYQLLKSL